MKKWLYFAIQVVLSCVITSITWYLFMVIGSIESYTKSMDFMPLYLLLGGIAVHIILTIIYVLFGWKNVDEWRWWCILISAAINIITFFIGIGGASAIYFFIRYY